MNITFCGAAREVGRSCVILDINNKYKVMFDSGVKITETGVVYPQIEAPNMEALKDVDAIFISHAHLDHTGSLPYMEHLKVSCPIFATPPTIKLSKILLRDAYKIGHMQGEIPYEHCDLDTVSKNFRLVLYEKEYSLDLKEYELKFKFLDAGHIQGSASIFLRIIDKKTKKEKTLIYSGDINTIDTKLLNKHFFMRDSTNLKEFKKVDYLITETTYGDREHLPRKEEEDRFIETVKERIQAGTVMVPTFGVQRAQELITLLDENGILDNYPVYLDGMAVRVTKDMLSEENFLRKPERLRKAYRKINLVRGYQERQMVVKKKGIFVTTSGMLSGGPVMSYLKHYYKDQNASILLTGFQCEGTNGKNLLELGYINLDDFIVKPACYFTKFDFSGHAGHKDLIKFVTQLEPRKVILNHGDEGTMLKFEKELTNKGLKTIVPKLDEPIKI